MPFNPGNRVVLQSVKGGEIYGTVKWVGPITRAELGGSLTVIGIETDKKIKLDDHFPELYLDVSGTNGEQLFKVRFDHTRVFLPEQMVRHAEEFALQKQLDIIKQFEAQQAAKEYDLDPDDLHYQEVILEKFNAIKLEEKATELIQTVSPVSPAQNSLACSSYGTQFSIGSMVCVPTDKGQPLNGVVVWIGTLPDFPGTVAGVELDDPLSGCSDGTWDGKRYFKCESGRGYFCPLTSLQQDARYWDNSPVKPCGEIKEEKTKKESFPTSNDSHSNNDHTQVTKKVESKSKEMFPQRSVDVTQSLYNLQSAKHVESRRYSHNDAQTYKRSHGDDHSNKSNTYHGEKFSYHSNNPHTYHGDRSNHHSDGYYRDQHHGDSIHENDTQRDRSMTFTHHTRPTELNIINYVEPVRPLAKVGTANRSEYQYEERNPSQNPSHYNERKPSQNPSHYNERNSSQNPSHYDERNPPRYDINDERKSTQYCDERKPQREEERRHDYKEDYDHLLSEYKVLKQVYIEVNRSQREREDEHRQLLELHDRLQESHDQLVTRYREKEENNRQLIEKNSSLERKLNALQNELEYRGDEMSTLQNKIRGMEDGNWKVSHNDVMLSNHELGRGAWGVVWIGEFRGSTVAVKQIHELISGNLKFLHREINIMAGLRHPNLLQFIGAVFDHPSGNPMIITEVMDTSLRKAYEEKELTPDQQPVILSIMREVAVGLNYLHSLPDPIIHRDVSSANVLLESKGPGKWKTKISDFGSAKLARSAHTAGPGAMVYTAPECLHSVVDSIIITTQTTKVDVFSYGVLLCETLTCQFPKEGSFRYMLQQIADATLYNLILSCVEREPHNRPNMKYIIEKYL